MSDENVGGLVAKWRHIASQLAIDPDHTDACAGQALQACAAELAAALSAHGQPVVDDSMVLRACLAHSPGRTNVTAQDMTFMRAAMTAALEGDTP